MKRFVIKPYKTFSTHRSPQRHLCENRDNHGPACNTMKCMRQTDTVRQVNKGFMQRGALPIGHAAEWASVFIMNLNQDVSTAPSPPTPAEI